VSLTHSPTHGAGPLTSTGTTFASQAGTYGVIHSHEMSSNTREESWAMSWKVGFVTSAALIVLVTAACASARSATKREACSLTARDSAYLVNGPVYRACEVDKAATVAHTVTNSANRHDDAPCLASARPREQTSGWSRSSNATELLGFSGHHRAAS